MDEGDFRIEIWAIQLVCEVKAEQDKWNDNKRTDMAKDLCVCVCVCLQMCVCVLINAEGYSFRRGKV